MFGAPALTKAGSPGRPGSPCGEGTEAEMGQTHRGSQGPSVSLPSPCCGAGGGTQPPATTHLLSSAASGSGWPLRGDSVSPGRGTHEVPPPTPAPSHSPQDPPRPGARRLPAAPGDEEEKRWWRGGRAVVANGKPGPEVGVGLEGVRSDQAAGLQRSNSARTGKAQVSAAGSKLKAGPWAEGQHCLRV